MPEAVLEITKVPKKDLCILSKCSGKRNWILVWNVKAGKVTLHSKIHNHCLILLPERMGR